MIKPEFFTAPPPVELGTITPQDFDAMAEIAHVLGSKYGQPDSWLLSPESIGCEVTAGRDVSVVTAINFGDSPDSAEYTTQALTQHEERLVLDALAPFTTASKGWLHANEPLLLDFFRSKQMASYPGPWHTDGIYGLDNFRAALFYDRFPTQFAVGRLANTAAVLADGKRTLEQLARQAAIDDALRAKDAELFLVDGPTPLTAVGMSNNTLHRVAPIDRADDGAIRTFMRLATRVL